MKKTLPIFIVFLLFFSQIGYRFIFLIQQHQLKEAAEERLFNTLNDSQFELIDAASNGLEWEEEDKEFSLNGQMYDVAKKEVVNGKTILYCLNDKKEEELLNNLTKTIKDSTDNSSGKDGKHNLKFQFADFTILTASTLTDQSFAINEYPEFTASIYKVVKKVITPPPNHNLYSQILIL